MKKNWLWISIVVIILLLLGGGFIAYKAMHKIANTMMIRQQQKVTEDVFSFIQEAIMNHSSLQCSFTSDDETNTNA